MVVVVVVMHHRADLRDGSWLGFGIHDRRGRNQMSMLLVVFAITVIFGIFHLLFGVSDAIRD
jgi:hypothetical protein